MQQIIVQTIFGWPFIVFSLLLAAAGVITKRAALVTSGAVLFTPPALYFTGYPAIGWFSLLLPLLILGAAHFVKQGKPAIAWGLLSPPILVSAWLAAVVISQNRVFSGG